MFSQQTRAQPHLSLPLPLPQQQVQLTGKSTSKQPPVSMHRHLATNVPPALAAIPATQAVLQQGAVAAHPAQQAAHARLVPRPQPYSDLTTKEQSTEKVLLSNTVGVKKGTLKVGVHTCGVLSAKWFGFHGLAIKVQGQEQGYAQWNQRHHSTPLLGCHCQGPATLITC
jgi:hypothetical protein